jgi:periplasmic copper chaperone A
MQLQTIFMKARCAVPLTLAALGFTAHAHLQLIEPQATAGSNYKATLRVGHGCAGSATTGLVLTLPEGFRAVKPQAKVGWVVSIRHDTTLEVRWRAATPEAALPDDQFDEFAVLARVPEQPGPVWLKVLQTCVQGQHDWSEVPTPGASTQNLKSPAVLLDIQPATHSHSHLH